jgi:hypothetical protein
MRLRSLVPPHPGLPHSNAISAGVSKFPIPDPRLWPNSIREWLRGVKGADARWNDVVIFDCGDCGALYLEDAIIAAQLVDANPAGWNVDEGFPCLVFDSSLIGECERLLSARGYRVRVDGSEQQPKKPAKRRRRAKVIDIAAARQSLGRHKRP